MTSKQHDYSAERQAATGNALTEFDAIAQRWRVSEYELIGFSIRCPRAEGDDYLITLRALNNAGQPVVAFHGAFNLLELWLGAWQRFRSGSLKWKEDTWGR